MMARTHETGGSLTGLVWISIIQPHSFITMAVMICSATIGSLLPDIDHGSSKLAHSNFLMRTLCTTINGIFGHRGLIHSPLACLGFGIAGFLLTNLCGGFVLHLFSQLGFGMNVDLSYYAVIIGIGFLLGSLNHLVYDSFNDAGIKWLQPFSDKRISLLPITTGSIFETVFMCVSIGLNLLLLYVLWQQGVFSI